MNQAFITVTGGPETGRFAPIGLNGVRIGRDPANELHIDDPEVSRHHARVILHNGVLWVQDAGSRNGVFVNGTRVSGNKQIGPGDRVTIGAHEFLIQLEGTGTDSSVSVNMGAVLAASAVAAPPDKNRQPLVIVAVLVAVLGLLAWVVYTKGLSGDTPETVVVPVSQSSGVSVASLLGPEVVPESVPEVVSTEERARVLAAKLRGEDGTVEDTIEPPRQGVTAAQLTDEADGQYRSGRLFDAVVTYRQALMLDSNCQICPLRIETINKEIKKKVQQNFNDGMSYQISLQYQEAQRAFSTVMELTKPGSALYTQAEQSYKEVTAAMQR